MRAIDELIQEHERFHAVLEQIPALYLRVDPLCRASS